MKEVHLICNAHIDPIWQWDWQEGVSAVLSTFQSAVDLLEEFDYVFCHNEVTVYEYVEEYAPALFAKIKNLVKEGKWHIMGGWYLQPDCNMPKGESFVRQIQEGKRYFKEKFGVTPKTAINFDSFGHSVGLVQIIKKCGQDSYIFMRPEIHYREFPSNPFIWTGLDGSEIKAFQCAGSYCTPLGAARDFIIERTEAQTADVVCVLWGVGNHGGGPSRKDLQDIEELKNSSTEKRYVHATPEAFFAKVQPTERVNESLRPVNPGCYTTMSRVKRKHALLENELYLTEKMLSAALACGLLKEYPEEKLHEIARDLLTAEFHDVLPGTCVQSGEECGIRFLEHGLLEAERLKTRAYFALSATQERAKEGEYPVIVFNPHPYAYTANIECEFSLANQNWSEEIVSFVEVYDKNGRRVRCQTIKEESNLNLDWRKRIIFEAELKPLQLNRYSVYVTYKQREKQSLDVALVYDDGRKYVEIDKKTGLLKKFSIEGVDYLKDAFLPVMFDDNPDPWGMSAFQLVRMGENEQAFTLAKKPKGAFEGMQSVQVVEDGDIYLGVEVFFEKESTQVRVEYRIYKNNDYVDVNLTVYFGHVDKILKVKLPICITGELLGQTAFGTEQLSKDAKENVAQRFIAMQQGENCLTVMNNGVYGSHFENGALYLSLLRGASYCAHPIANRPILPENKFVKKVDQGEHNYAFRIGVLPHHRLERATQEFVQKPYGLNIFPVKADETAVVGQKTFEVALEDDTVSTAAIKKADGRDGILFRLVNNTSKSVETALCVNEARLPLMFGKFEVKTVLWENGSLQEMDEMLI